MGNKVILSFFLWNLITLFSFTSSQVTRTFTIQNHCPKDVWFASNIPNYPGFRMTPGYTTSFPVSGTFNGRAWGQYGCTFNSANQPTSCQVCSDGGKCTLAEFNLGGWNNIDFYDISLVDGYTLSTSITTNIASASGFTCGNPVCNTDFSKCPAELLIYNADGSINSCQNVCSAVNNPSQVAKFPVLSSIASRINTCCGTRDTTVCGPTTWPVSSNGLNYYQVFKQQCSTSYAYPDDDSSSTFTCQNLYPNFVITFCPSGSVPAPPPPPPPAPAPPAPAPPAPAPPAVAGTCANSNSHVRCWGLGGGAVQSSQANCAKSGCSGGSTTWSWNAVGGACWTGTAQYCIADPSTVADGSAQWYSGGAQTNINTCATSLTNTRCWGLGGGGYQASAAACAKVGCAAGSTAWSWNANGGACWTGTAQYCLGDTGTFNGNAQWFSGGAGANVQSAQAAVGSSTWFKQKGYWIVVAIVLLLILIGVVLYFTFRSRNRGNSFEAPEKAATPIATAKPDVAMTSPTVASGEEQMLKPTDTDVQVGVGVATPALADTPWVQRKDESGNNYYYNEKTGASQWETPDV